MALRRISGAPRELADVDGETAEKIDCRCRDRWLCIDFGVRLSERGRGVTAIAI